MTGLSEFTDRELLEEIDRRRQAARDRIYGLNKGRISLIGLGALDRAEEFMMDMDQIIDRVSKFYKVTLKDLRSPSRRPQVAWPRQVAMYLIVHKTSLGRTWIGDYFNRDQSTVTAAIQAVDHKIRRSTRLQNELARIEAMLGGATDDAARQVP